MYKYECMNTSIYLSISYFLSLSYPSYHSLFSRCLYLLSFSLQGYLPDGTLFDSSRDRGRPLKFRLGSSQVVPGLGDTFT